MGPRAWSLSVLMPISAPMPNSPPSLNRVLVLMNTAAESTRAANAWADPLVLLEQASGRPVPGARVTAVLTPVDGGGTPVRVPLRPVLGRYDHYTGHTAAPGGPVRVRLEVLRPTFATLEAKAFDGRVALELPDSVRPQASAADRPDASSKRP